MKSLKKKVCVSVFLDELFEAVDDHGKKYICGNLKNIREGDKMIMKSQLISEEFLFRKVTRPRKYRNPLAISQRGHMYFRDQFQDLETEEDWGPPVVEKVDRETSTSLKSDDENDFDVDEYSLSDLNLDNLGLDDVEGEDSSWTRKTKKVDIALSTCFAEHSSKAEESHLETNPQREAQLSEQVQKIHEGTQTEGGHFECERPSLKGQKIVEDLSQNNKCFLVGRCAKSINLAAWNHKSTQLTLATSTSEEANTARVVNAGGGELEEIFHYMNSQKHSMNTLKRMNNVLTDQTMRTSQVLETNHDAIGDFFQAGEKWGCTAEGTESEIIREGFCDVTVKTFVKTKREHILCYTLSIPWEVTNFGALIFPENNFSNSHGTSGSLTEFTSRPHNLSEPDSFLMGTQCENAIGKYCGSASSVGPLTEEQRKSEKMGEDLNARSEPGTEEPNKVETSTLEEQRVVESLASEITEQIKLFDRRKEERIVEDKSVNTESHTKSEEDDLIVQWELEIEIQNKESSEITEPAQTENSKSQMIKTIEGSSNTNVVLICQTPYENSVVIEDCSQHSRLSEIEQCYLKDEKIRKMYLANVPRHILRVTEQRLKEIGRS